MVLYDLYIIYNEGGIAIQNYKFGGLNVNTELVGPFLSALSTFAMETIRSKGQMRLVDRGNVKILFEQGNYVTLALFASDSTAETRGLLLSFLQKFEETFRNALKNWSGSLDVFAGSEHLIKSVFKREKVSKGTIPPRLMPNPIPPDEVARSKMRAEATLPVIRTAVRYGLSGVLSISLNPFKIEPIGYVSFVRGKGWAAVYNKPYSKIRRGSDAARHIIFDSLTLPAWIKFRTAENHEIDTDLDRTINRIDSPLNRIALDTVLLRHRFNEIRSLKPKSKPVLSQDEIDDAKKRFGEAGVNVLTASKGKATLEQIAPILGLSSLEVTEIALWATEKGLIEMAKV